MKPSMKRYLPPSLIHTFLSLLLLGSCAFAQAQNYPNRPIKVVIPFAPGGPSDIVGRVLMQQMSENLNTPIIIENKPGGGSNIGIQQVAKSAPDGYTLLLVSSTFVINPTLYPNPGFDANKDFAAVALPVSSPNVLVVNPNFPAKDIKEFFAVVKAAPGKYDYASPGAGTGPHLSAELLKLKMNLDIAHIPYNGGGPALQAVLGNQVPIGLSALPPAVPQVKGGALRALAVTSTTRSPSLPDVPTLKESGVTDFEGDTLQFIVAPAGTPTAIVQKLNREITKALDNPELKSKLIGMGYLTYNYTPEQTTQKVKVEVDKWAKVIQSRNIKPD
ncbi:tripartite tricarboxylate transporter substrate binding protein [Polynucleobacter sp. Latsch14-2]|uniref:Bug family tripartite tricarboxylate transporter substrate binding protein n=1 Tax=Polynucleobacter sp. Latsch14-2 TaxID=2576920 RepID=UPI001C0D2ACC|nr:tripartite tricarboxylate transporter substrate binding protein [Polynucleobacter sp. Latsch14-2]